MLDMCKYNMASQQNSTTQSSYSLGSEEPSITNMGLMTQHTEHTSTCRSLTCLNTDNYKWRRLRSLTIYKTLPRVQDHSWGNKLLVEVQAELLVRQMSHLQNINKANVSTKVLSKTYIRSYHTCICIKKVMWGLVAASQLWLSGYPVLWLLVTLLRWRTRVH